MAIFIGIHKFLEPTSEEEMQNGWEKYKKECEKMGIKAWRVYYNLQKGAFCLTEAPTEAQVRKAHETLSFSLEDLIEVKSSE